MTQEQILCVILIAFWELTCTAVACWYAARDGEKQWYILFFLLTLLGIPELIYISKKRKEKSRAAVA